MQSCGKQLSVLFCLSLLAGNCLHCSGGHKEVSDTSLRLAPDFVLTDVNGRSGKLSDYRGKVVILDFWATWCGPCRMQIPHFVELYKRYKDSGFEMIGVAMDRPDAVRPLLKKYAVNYTNFIGNREVATKYGGLRGIPTTFVITKEGRIFRKYVGVPPNARVVFEEDIKSLLSL